MGAAVPVVPPWEKAGREPIMIATSGEITLSKDLSHIWKILLPIFD